ncbi:hypothetical protein ACHAXM_009017, partial [Skeletonema potamos]
QERPYHSDSTASRLLSEVKHCRARLVLRWGTTLESLVLFFCLVLRWGTTLESLVLFFCSFSYLLHCVYVLYVMMLLLSTYFCHRRADFDSLVMFF